MAGLFGGTPQTATSYVTSSSETPKWMQDAIYNQVNWATNVAQQPYEQYQGQTVAGLTPYQQQAYKQTVDTQGAWVPAMNQAMVGTGGQTNSTDAQTAAQPYLNKAGASSATGIQDFMNPYTQNVTDMIARLGARNLSENLLPAVSDSFVKAGQFGGTRMGEFGSRALRDTQDSVLNQQATALQSGYGQALTAAQQEASRQGQLATTAGGLATTDAQRQLAAQQQLGALSQQAQTMQTGDTARLEAAGSAYQSQQQRELDAQYQQYQRELLYPKQQLDWLSTQVRGMAPITPQTTTQANTTTSNTGLSPLSQIASAASAGAGLANLLG